MDRTTTKAQPVLRARIRGVAPTATAQQKGAMVMPDGHIRFYKKASVLKAERTWWEMLRPVRDRLPEPYCGPVRISVELTFPHLASTPKRTLGRTVPLDKRPDIDNLVKSLLDTLTAMNFWRDDGQVYSLAIAKRRGPEPGVALEIWPSGADGRDEICVEA